MDLCAEKLSECVRNNIHEHYQSLQYINQNYQSLMEPAPGWSMMKCGRLLSAVVHGGARWRAHRHRVVVDVEAEGDALVERRHRLLSAVDGAVVRGGVR